MEFRKTVPIKMFHIRGLNKASARASSGERQTDSKAKEERKANVFPMLMLMPLFTARTMAKA